jgi:hypothetical protein
MSIDEKRDEMGFFEYVECLREGVYMIFSKFW